MAEGEYSFSLTTFSPSGKLVQIEYAFHAVAAGRCALGIKASNGVVLATEKKTDSVLVEKNSLKMIENINERIGCVFAGMGPDFRLLLRKSRKEAMNYWSWYKEPTPVRHLVRRTAGVMQEYTQQGGVRPFGCSLMVAGFDDEHGAQLFQIDPSGSYFGWKASAIGKNYVNAKSFLEKRYNEEMELEDAIHTAILTLKEGFEGAISKDNIEIGIIKNDDPVFKVLTPDQVADYLHEVE